MPNNFNDSLQETFIRRLQDREPYIRDAIFRLGTTDYEGGRTWSMVTYESLLFAVSSLVFCENPDEPGSSWLDFVWRSSESDCARVLDFGDYQGYKLLVMPASGYQPSEFLVMKIGYGSCSGCDAIQAVTYSDGSYSEIISGLYKIVCDIVRTAKIV